MLFRGQFVVSSLSIHCQLVVNSLPVSCQFVVNLVLFYNYSNNDIYSVGKRGTNGFDEGLYKEAHDILEDEALNLMQIPMKRPQARISVIYVAYTYPWAQGCGDRVYEDDTTNGANDLAHGVENGLDNIIIFEGKNSMLGIIQYWKS